MAKISGKNIRISLDDLMIKVKKASLKIEDGRAVAKTNGIPHSHVDGEVGADGSIEISTQYLTLLIEQARKAGSFKQLPTFDLVFFAEVVGERLKVEAFGCLLKIDSLLDIDGNGGEDLTHTLPFNVTSPDFVRINGVPYLSEEETEGLF